MSPSVSYPMQESFPFGLHWGNFPKNEQLSSKPIGAHTLQMPVVNGVHMAKGSPCMQGSKLPTQTSRLIKLQRMIPSCFCFASGPRFLAAADSPPISGWMFTIGMFKFLTSVYSSGRALESA